MKQGLSWSRALLLVCAFALAGSGRLGGDGQAATAGMRPSYAGATILGLHGSVGGGAAAVVGVMGHLTAYVSVSGLKAGSTHAEQIHAGLCGGRGPVRYPLNPLVADGSGRAFSMTTVPAGKVQPMGWSVDVGAADASLAPLACGNLWGPDLSFPLQPTRKARAEGTTIILGNMDTRGGMATRDTGVVIVTLMRGLPANSVHAEHLHKGTCGSNGAIVFPLTPLAAGAGGDAVAATFVSNMARVMDGGLYLDVHAADGGALSCGNDPGGTMHGSMQVPFGAAPPGVSPGSGARTLSGRW